MTGRSKPSKTSPPYKPSLWPMTLSVNFWQLHTLSCWRRRMSKPQKCNTLTAKWIFCHSSQPPSSPLHRCHLPISPLRLQRKVFSPPEPSCFLSCFSLWALVSELGKGLPCKDSSKCSAMLALQFLRSPLIYGCRGQFDYLCPVPPEWRSFCS